MSILNWFYEMFKPPEFVRTRAYVGRTDAYREARSAYMASFEKAFADRAERLDLTVTSDLRNAWAAEAHKSWIESEFRRTVATDLLIPYSQADRLDGIKVTKTSNQEEA